MTLFQECASRDDARAEYILALCYKNGGVGVEKNPDLAFYYFKKASVHGDVDALFRLAMCYYEGDGVNKDITQAISCFREAADHGDAEAAYRLSLAFSRGEGVSLDAVEATRWLEIAADCGHAESQFQLGLRYRHGQGALRQPDVVMLIYFLLYHTS